MIKPYTISAHLGDKLSRDHNIRSPKVVQAEGHIDENGYHKTILDIPIREAYREVFGQAQLDYNANQKRSDRLIADYFSKVLESHKKDPKRNPATSKELIFTIGNVDNHPSRVKSERILTENLERFKKANPNIFVYGAYFHADEPGSAPHMHVDFIFIKRENKRGMSLQVGQEGALREMGYFTRGTKKEGNQVTAQMQWQDDTREMLRSIAKESGLIVEEKGVGKENVKHLDTKIFKKKSELKKMEQEVSQLEKKVEVAKKAEKVSLDKVQALDERIAQSEEKIRRDVKLAEKKAEQKIRELDSQVNLAEVKTKDTLEKLKNDISKEQEKYDEIHNKYESLEDLEFDNFQLRQENKKLKSALWVLQKGLDLIEKAAKTLFNINVWWQKDREKSSIKSYMKQNMSKEQYEEYQSVRHDKSLYGTPSTNMYHQHFRTRIVPDDFDR